MPQNQPPPPDTEECRPCNEHNSEHNPNCIPTLEIENYGLGFLISIVIVVFVFVILKRKNK